MEATEKPIEITVAANAGVMIRAGNTVILADVLEDAGPYPFDRLILCCLKWLKGRIPGGTPSI